VAAGSLGWDTPVAVTPEHLAVGDGVLATWPLPVTLPLHAVAQLMTALSDNTATNAWSTPSAVSRWSTTRWPRPGAPPG
jgi:beta-lactamase class A